MAATTAHDPELSLGHGDGGGELFNVLHVHVLPLGHGVDRDTKRGTSTTT